MLFGRRAPGVTIVMNCAVIGLPIRHYDIQRVSTQKARTSISSASGDGISMVYPSPSYGANIATVTDRARHC